jgi:hypothetical protein
MSCDTNSNKAGRAGVKAGLAALSSQFSHVAGAMLDRAALAAYRLGEKAAGASNTLLNVVDRQGLPARLARENAVRGLVAGVAMEELGRRKLAPGEDVAEQVPMRAFIAAGASEVLPLAVAVGATQQASAALVTLAARASRDGQVGLVTQKRLVNLLGVPLGEADEKVTFWRSRLTGTLNALDLLPPIQSQDVRSSDGVLFQTGGVTWHRGTMLVNTPKGERLITHLQNLALPPTHYYFNCHLTGEQAAGIAARRIRPERLPGYIGQVSALESLTVGWASVKHALIRSVLYWGMERNP